MASGFKVTCVKIETKQGVYNCERWITIVNMVEVRNFMELSQYFDVITWKQYIPNGVFQTM